MHKRTLPGPASDHHRDVRNRRLPTDDPCARLSADYRDCRLELERRNKELRRSRAQVAEIADRYAELYEFAPVGLFLLDGDYRVVEANLTGLEMLGRKRAEAQDTDFSGWVRLVDGEPFRKACRLTLDRRRRTAFEVGLVRGNGTPLHAWVETAPVIGRSDRLRVALVELSERVGAERDLRPSRELLHGILDTIPAMVAIYDPNRRRFEVNREFRRVLGWAEDDLNAGDPMEMCYPDPDYREMVRCYMESLEAGWRDFEVRAKDGSVVDSAWANIRLSDDTHVGIGIDMRGRRAADGELLKSRERLRLAAETAGLGVFEWHVASDRAVWENRKMYDLFARAVEMGPLGKSEFLREVIHPDDAAEFERQLASAAQSELPWRTTFRIRTDNGVRSLEALGQFAMREGRPERLVGVVADVTDRLRIEEELREYQLRKQMDQSLRESQNQLRDLSRKSIEALEADRRAVSRELHDSIGGSLAALKFMLEELADNAASACPASAAAFERAIAYLAETIRETKRISVSLRPLTLDDLGLVATVKSHLRQFRNQFGAIRVEAAIEVRESEVPDAQKIVLYRLLQESLVNVAKHSGADRVSIRLRKPPNGGIELEVRDNGFGFDPGQRSAGKSGLRGYGLRSMQERVEICHGSFAVESRPGGGTCVRAVFQAE